MVVSQRFLLKKEEFTKDDRYWWKLVFFNAESGKIETVEVMDPETKVVIENQTQGWEDELQGY